MTNEQKDKRIAELEGGLRKMADPRPTFAGPECCKSTFEDACELFSDLAASLIASAPDSEPDEHGVIKLEIAAVERIHAEVRRRERERCIDVLREASKGVVTWGEIISRIRELPEPDASEPDAGEVVQDCEIEHWLAQTENYAEVTIPSEELRGIILRALTPRIDAAKLAEIRERHEARSSPTFELVGMWGLQVHEDLAALLAMIGGQTNEAAG